MHYSRKTTQIAMRAAAGLIAISTLSLALAMAERGGQVAARESSQPAWYRLWNDLEAGQNTVQLQVSSRQGKTTPEQSKVPEDPEDLARQVDKPTNAEESRAEPPARPARWFNVSDAGPSENRTQERGTANPRPTPREVTPDVAKPLVAQPTGSSAAGRIWKQLLRTPPTENRRPGNRSNQAVRHLVDRNQRSATTEREAAAERQVPANPEYIDDKPVVAVQATPLPADHERAPKRVAAAPSPGMQAADASSGAVPRPRPQAVKQDLAGVQESRLRVKLEFKLPDEEPKDVRTTTPSVASGESVAPEEFAANAGPKFFPAPVEEQHERDTEIEVPALLPLTKPNREEPIALSNLRPFRSSQPATRTVNVQLDVATLRRLRLNDPVDHIEVADRQVCEAYSQADRQLSLVAKRNGETSVTIHYATDRAPEVYAIRVGPREKQQDRLAGDLQLQKLVAETFSDADVLITPKGQTLIVTGAVRSSAEALRVLSFVRSLRLVPVVDQLKVLR